MKKLITIIIVCVFLTGCTSEEPLKTTSNTTNNNTKISPEVSAETRITPLIYKPLPPSKAKIIPGNRKSVVVAREVKLKDATVILYYKEDGNNRDFYAGIECDDRFFEIEGLVGYDKADDIEISEVDFNGIPLIKIAGYQGASAPITQYIIIENNAPKSFIQLYKYAAEYKVNDGRTVFITTEGGTIPMTGIIKKEADKFQVADLNEILGGIVVFNYERKRLEAYLEKNQEPEIYELTDDGLEYVGD